MGNVVMGNYPISLSSWAFTFYRSHVIDHVEVIRGDTYAMFAIPTLPENDFGFFFRPFKNHVWYLSTGLWILLISVFSIVKKNTRYDLISADIIIFMVWMFFTLLSAYYGGALTMFFINEEQIPFRNIKEAVKAFPDWKIIVNTDIGVYLDGVVKRVRVESSIVN